MSVELRQLRALVTVVEEGTFTDAAIVLGLSQASVSRAVATLEQTLGVRLLRRTTREVSLTVVGARVIEHARRVLGEIVLLEQAAAASTGELRVGYAWAALGRHTLEVQRRWAAEHPSSELVFVQSNTRTAGLADGLADLAVLRRPIEDARFHTVLVGVEARYAAVAGADPLARRRSLRLADLAERTIAVDSLTGTTTDELWPPGSPPPSTRPIHGIEEWLTLIAGGGAVGITSEATARQHLRPGVAYRPLRDAPPMPVTIAWWADNPPPLAQAFVALVCATIAA
jgi:DNA-binding transcriptional LysR family regulator